MKASNNAKLREAVKDACDKLLLWNYTDGDTARIALGVINKLDAAIAEPARQCDVGTAEEQEVRFDGFCMAHKEIKEPGLKACSDNCPFVKKGFCDLHWAQMPYESEAGK